MTQPIRTTRGPRRWLAAAAAAALGSALLPISTAGAAIDTSAACPTAIPSAGFTDLADNPAASAVDCLAAYGVAQGVTETDYVPSISINRAQVATFLVRILEGVDGFVLPEPVGDAFDDDDGYAPHEANINVASQLGIIDGYADGTFRPRELVSRAQMAKLVVGTLRTAGVAVPEVNPDAFDDDEGSTHEGAINALAALDVVDGVQVGTYDPSGTVRRDTMALYLTRSIQVLVDDARWTPYVAVGVVGLDGATVGEVEAFDVTASSTVAIAGASVGFEVTAPCLDIDGDGTADDAPLSLEAVVGGTNEPVAVTCVDGTTTGTYPAAGTDIAAGAALTIPMAVTFDVAQSYPIAVRLLDADGAPQAVAGLTVDVLGPPTALSAELTGGNNFTYGNDVGDTITVVYDRPMAVDAAASVAIDPDGAAGPANAATFVCGTNLSCAAVDNAVTFIVNDPAAVTGDVLLDAGAEVTATTGVTSPGGTAPEGYPVALLVNVVRLVDFSAAVVGQPTTFNLEAASNEAVAGATFGFSVDATCVDTDADGQLDDAPFTLDAAPASGTVSVALTCDAGVVTGVYPVGGVDLAADVLLAVPMVLTFDVDGTYPLLVAMQDADLDVLDTFATDIAVAVAP